MITTLESINIQDFRGIALTNISFNKNTEKLLAPFGYGKTTIKEAFLWGLGLPIQNVKPCKFENNRWVELPHTTTCVELKLVVNFETDKQELVLKRQDKNGTSTFYINDDKLTSLKAYQEQVLQNIGLESIEVLKDLTIVSNFMARDNKEIRKILFDLSKANEVLVETQNSYDTLKQDFINGLTTEEISLSIKRELKKVEEEQTVLKTKIDTYQEFIKEHTTNVESLNERKEKVEQYKVDVEKEIRTISYDLQNKYNNANFNLQQEKHKFETENTRLGLVIQNANSQIALLERPLQEAKEKVETISAREIDKINICPTCGAKLPIDNALTHKLEQQKAIDLDNARNVLDNLTKQYQEQEKIIANAQSEMQVLIGSSNIPTLSKLVKTIKDKLDNINEELTPQKDYLASLDEELDEINSQLTTQALVVEQQELVKTTQKELKQLLIKIQNIYKKQDDLKDYLSNIEVIITNRVNEFFLSNETGLSWKLYENSKNGNLQTTAELICQNSKQYSNCSRGERLYADCKLLFFLQEAYNVYLPIFVDNITDLGGETFKSNKQIIYLETDKENTNFEIEKY